MYEYDNYCKMKLCDNYYYYSETKVTILYILIQPKENMEYRNWFLLVSISIIYNEYTLVTGYHWQRVFRQVTDVKTNLDEESFSYLSFGQVLTFKLKTKNYLLKQNRNAFIDDGIRSIITPRGKTTHVNDIMQSVE